MLTIARLRGELADAVERARTAEALLEQIRVEVGARDLEDAATVAVAAVRDVRAALWG
jgi:hypothetical protein